MKARVKFLLVVVLLTASAFCFKLSAQNPQTPVLLPLLDSLTLDTMEGYTDLNEALKNPEKVTKIVLRKHKYTQFPAELWKFPNLQYLDLGKNNIKEVPDSINYFKNLQVLHLSKNKIEFIPREIGDLSNLMILDLNQNELVAIPPQIGKLKKLQYLDLWSNNLSIFPEELKDISGNLKILDLRAILINKQTQDHIKSLLPNTLIHFSPPCKCDQ
ncbi:MAG: hypothetical protein Fur0041_09500 [Bacteroidia bacterium]